ncbi:hypothetical protein [Hymenobacter weizhouensis]|uniref:hypothetical protein n=1 Tax=Hymenobacter sp. YIM 151500-1 TaxID=2987689 RepID=UPI00222711AF|nr:hypothetical protein [Hymenobacter sp. YIM 151500-1]UYZ61709.1 hypothetical protein OIS53_11905 [Hymenobacter sp. YIM 151500-1]
MNDEAQPKLDGKSSAKFVLTDGAEDPDGGTIDLTPQLRNQYLDNLAKTLAIVIRKNPEVGRIIKNNALQKIDGDYDILYSNLENTNVSGSTIGELMRQEGFQNFIPKAGENTVSLGISDEYSKKTIISIPSNIEDYTENIILNTKVASFPFGNDETISSVVAYDGDGNSSTVSALQEPSEPYVVVSFGERIDDAGLVKEEFRNLNDPSGRTQNRNVNDGEFITAIKCNNLGAIEPWLRGKPELRLYVASAVADLNTSGPPTVNGVKIQDGVLFATAKRKEIDNKFYSVNDYRLFTWTQKYSDYYTMAWIEEDGGPTVTFKLSVTPKFAFVTTSTADLNIDFSNWEKDDNLGSVQVYRPDLAANTLGEIRFGTTFTTQIISKP